MSFAAALFFLRLLLFRHFSVFLSRPLSLERRHVSHALARPPLSQRQTAALICVFFFFISSTGSFSAGTTHTHVATNQSFGFAAVTPGFERLPGKATPGEEKHLGKSSRRRETRRLKVSDGSQKKAHCIAFRCSSYRFICCQLALTEAAAETSGIVFWQHDRVRRVNPG